MPEEARCFMLHLRTRLRLWSLLISAFAGQARLSRVLALGSRRRESLRSETERR
ncbi:hypothetical protein BAUCODRAFT_32787 [Baudoinia panamericana UAMH 10762]|uniref:Uncharacterized protein n=1 Tax=Baudoinia panamericana (strain UAMH 10762) TaxID=717646 RepID=M2MZK5_BAUPA|nr:uncharacterized protein BAUCODRAFT_32787 [Baudoinia panamericana UAMH 10762]EMC97043.1 hypothetical protein BAUCODRAFT_32787 [Baudoinia panamericana UAMH 10762]